MSSMSNGFGFLISKPNSTVQFYPLLRLWLGSLWPDGRLRLKGVGIAWTVLLCCRRESLGPGIVRPFCVSRLGWPGGMDMWVNLCIRAWDPELDISMKAGICTRKVFRIFMRVR